MTAKIKNTLQKNSENEIEELRSRLAEAEETLNAIRGGEVDSIMVSTPDGEKVFSISSAETPYRIFIEEMNEGAAILSEEGTILYCNKQLAVLFSIPIEKVVGANFSEYISPEDGDNFESLLEAGIKEKSMGEVTYVDPKGSLHSFSISLSSFPSLGKNEVCMIITDITELKKSEEDLNNSRLAAIESEQRYKKLFDDDLTGDFIADADGEIFLCNIAFAKIFGFESVEELLGKNITSFYKDLSDRDEFIKQLHEQKKIEQLEREFVNRKGEIISVIENVIGEFDESGELILIQGYIFDNTERKRAEVALRVSEIKYRGLYDSIRDAILVANTDRKIVECNPTFTDLFGYSLDEIENEETITIYENEEQFNELGRALKDHSGNAEPFLYTVNYKKKNGVVFPGETSIYYLHNGGGNVKGFIGLIRDVSERVISEKRQSLISTILAILNRPNDWSLLVSSILSKIKEFTEIEAIGIRYKEGEDFPYLETNGFSKNFVKMEKYLCSRDKEGEIICDPNGSPYLECMCGNIITGRTDPALPFFTTGGSFWTNNTSELLKSTSGIKGQGRILNRCNAEGYQSVTLIPIHSENKIMGLLQFNDKRANMFTLDFIEFFEKIGSAIGIAFKRMRSEILIKENEESLRRIFEDSPIGMALSNESFNFVRINPSFCKMLGYTEEEMLRLTFKELTHPENLVNDIEKVGELFGGGSSIYETEKRYIKKNGEVVWGHLNLSKILDVSGKLANYLVMLEDITGRKQLEQEKENLTINLNERVKELTCLFTISSIFETVDISFEEMLNQVVKTIPPGFQYPDICCAKIILDKNEYQTSNYKETSWKMSSDINVNDEKNGAVEVFYLEEKEEIYEGPFFKEERELLNQVAERIGEVRGRKLAEELLIKSEQELRSLAESMPQIVWATRPDGWNIYFNQKWVDYTGMTLEESYGHGWNKPFHPDDQQIAWDAWQNATKNISIYSIESRIRSADGVYNWFLVKGVPMLDENSNIIKWFGTCTDINGLKLSEKELIEAKERAEISDKMKTEFLAQMSHEIRTPIHVVTSFTSLLKDELTPIQAEENQDILYGIESASKRIIRTVDLILNMSEIQLGSYEPLLKEINLNEVIAKIVREYSGMALKKQLQLKFNVNNHIYKIIGDEYSVNQIFANLIDNAIKYTSTGTIELSFTKSSKDHLIVSVEDTGIGISEEYLKNIFLPFSQEYTGYSRGYEGNGLGLALVKKYCALNNAKITVESIKGLGSKFSVTFKV